MKVLRRSIAVVLGFALVCGSLAPGVPVAALAAGVGLVDGLWVMQKVDEVYGGDDMQQDLFLTLERPGAKGDTPRTMDVRWLEKDYGKESRLIIHFLDPDYARGVTLNMTVKPYLDDDRWLFFPETKIIRRITSRDEHSNFMGTDFTYYDLSEREPDEEEHTLLRIEEFKGSTCYVVETKPRERVPNGYGRKITWIDKDRFLKLRIQYFNVRDQLRKQYDPDRWQQISGIWTPLLLVMEDFLAGHRTTIERRKVVYNQGVKDAFFFPQNVDCVVYSNGAFGLIPFEQRPTRIWEDPAKRKLWKTDRGAAKKPAN